MNPMNDEFYKKLSRLVNNYLAGAFEAETFKEKFLELVQDTPADQFANFMTMGQRKE